MKKAPVSKNGANCLASLDYQILCDTEGKEVANEIMHITVALQKEDAMKKITN